MSSNRPRRPRRGRRAMRMLVTTLLTLAAALTVSSCHTEPRRPSPAERDYVAVPDDAVFAAIRALPEVRDAEVSYVDQLGTSNTYRATLTLRPGLRRAHVRQVYAEAVHLLRHGRWDAATVVSVVSGDVVVMGAGLDLVSSADYEDRFGPQRGAADWPPSPLPTPDG